MGAEADVHIDVGYPAVYNNEQVTENAALLAKEYFGDDNVEETELRMGAEDFGFYAQKLPACFFRLGVRNEQKVLCIMFIQQGLILMKTHWNMAPALWHGLE